MSRPNRALVDTSAWIDALRQDGDREIASIVKELAADGQAVLCDIVRLELWNGAGGEAETKLLRGLERDLECVATTDEVWARARSLARLCSARGLSVPATDLLVAACAEEHDLALVHHDGHFEQIGRATSAAKRR
jgi:predicted nucleic acid-binding protein